MMGLTPVQNNCMSLIRQRMNDTGIAPSFREIADHLGLRSVSGVHRIMDGLEDRGMIRRLPRQARAIEIVPENETRNVLVKGDLWAPLVRYATAEKINLETAVNQFIRDGLESA